MEDLLDLDLDVGSCSWRFWDGLDQDVSYFDAVLPLDADFGLCSASSEENTLAPSPPSEDSATTTSADSTTFEPQLGDNLQDGVSESTVESVESRAGSKATSRNAARERSRVRSLRSAFQALQMSLPSVPPDTKLSKLDVLVLASNYIAHLGALLSGNQENADTCLQEQVPALESASSRSYLHPVKKWPMRSRLYAGASPYTDDRSKRHNCTDQWQAKKSRSSKPPSNRRNALA